MIKIIEQLHEMIPERMYRIFKARVDVFVVEQKCAYQEIDEYDTVAYHISLVDDTNTKLLAYCRVLPPHTTFDTCSIGRVLATKRHQGYATELLKTAIPFTLEKFNTDTITIEAQTYARSLYEKLGFQQTSDSFLEDGIEHIQMQYKKNGSEFFQL